MSCCGKMRSNVQTVQRGPVRPPGFLFEYVGRTALTIVGPGSRTSYRFDRPGARMLVDSRDRASLAATPVLRQVSG
jgi:hypothetical protein